MPSANSFTALRLGLALTVVFAHAFPLGGLGEDLLARWSGGQANLGGLAVCSFFLLSGFLIAGSAERQPLWRFVLNRAARILPGFWVMQLLTVFVLVPAILIPRSGGALGYWGSIEQAPYSAFDYLVLNACLHVAQYPIGDLFAGNPGGPAVNGSLWSLAPEVTCYFYLGLLALLRGLRWKGTGLLLFAGLFGLNLACQYLPGLAPKAALLMENGGIYSFELALVRDVFLAFLAGVVCYQFRDVLRWRGWMAALAGAALIVSCTVHVFAWVWPFALPFLIFYLAHRPEGHRVEQWGDFSYGIYIYAFPIQQCLTLAGVHRWNFAAYLAASIILSLVAGMLSWRWIERPVLNGARALGRSRPSRDAAATGARQLELFAEKA